MANRPQFYRRLPGTGKTIAHYVQLYQGPDHLLQVKLSGFTEEYKRFYYRDIQALVLRRTHTGKILNSILGGFAAIFGASAFIAAGSGGEFPLGFLAGICFLFLLVNLLLGPTGVCHLRTAVQTEKLVSLGRARRARKVIDRLRPLIVEAQRPLAAPAIAAVQSTPAVVQPDSLASL